MSATYLDLDIKIINNKFEYSLFDKRNAFPFYIIRFPYASSNIPIRMFYSTIQAEILRICRASAQFRPFLDTCKPFVTRMIKQGAWKKELNFSLNKIISNHWEDFSKYANNKNIITRKILEQIEIQGI